MLYESFQDKATDHAKHVFASSRDLQSQVHIFKTNRTRLKSVKYQLEIHSHFMFKVYIQEPNILTINADYHPLHLLLMIIIWNAENTCNITSNHQDSHIDQ